MKALPKIPEAVIPGTPFGIEVLKVALALFSLMSLVAAIPGLHSIQSEHFHFVASRNIFGRLIALSDTVIFAVGLYGVHRRVPAAWKVGWFYLGFFYLSSIFWVVVSPRYNFPASDRLIVSVIWIVLSSAVAAYWGRWWNNQKGYFVSKS